MRVRAVDPVQPVERALESRNLRQVGEVRIAGRPGAQLALPGPAQVGRQARRRRLLVRMGGEPAGAEQRRVLLAEAARRGRRARAALGLRGRAPELAVVRIDAVQRPQEDQRLHVGEHAPGVHAVRRHLAEQDLVRPGGVAGGLERAPRRIHEVSVDMRAVRDRLVAPGSLRRDVVAVVRLVPDRPEAHARQRRGRAGRLVGPVIAGADGLDEIAELLRRRLPVLAEVAGGALRRS